MMHNFYDPPHYDVKYNSVKNKWEVIAHAGLAQNTLENFPTKKKALKWAKKRVDTHKGQEVHVYSKSGELQRVEEQ